MKWNSLPTPGWLSTPISPPIISTSLRQMARPRPVPPCSRVLEASTCENGRNSDATWPGVRPMPVSLTVKRSVTEAGSVAGIGDATSCDTRCAVTTTISPCSVNLTALPHRLTSTCSSRIGSPASTGGTSGAVLSSSSSPLHCAFRPISAVRRPNTSSSEKSRSTSASLPASMREKSRMSSMTPSSDPAASRALPM